MSFFCFFFNSEEFDDIKLEEEREKFYDQVKKFI